MIDMYGSQHTEAAKGVTGRAVTAGAEATAGLRPGAASKGAFAKALRMKQVSLMDALEMWGTKNVLNWKESGAAMLHQVDQSLEEMRTAAQKARAEGDMETYKLALQQILFDKQMKARADQMADGQLGSIVSAIVGGLGQIGAGLASMPPKAQYEPAHLYEPWAREYA